MTEEMLKGLGSNGPWALVAGFLIWHLLKLGKEDRDQVVNLLTTFRTTLDGLKSAVEKLTDRIDGMEHKQ
jgi:hypothetical protein